MKDLRWTLQAFFGEVTNEKSAKKLNKGTHQFLPKRLTKNLLPFPIELFKA